MAKLYFKVGSDWEEVVKLRNEIGKLKQELRGIDSTQFPAVFKALNTQLAASTQRMDELVTNAAKAGAEMAGDFKRKIFGASQMVNGLTEKMITRKAVVKDTEADVKRLGEAYRIALKRNPMSANNKLIEYTSAKRVLDEDKAALFGLTQQQANARLAVKKLRDEYALYKDDGKQVVETNNGIAVSWKKALAVVGGAAALKALGSEIIRVRGEFQSMQTAMETMVGKDVAGPLMAQVKELAKISPLTMTDMVGAEKMMLGFNIQAEDTIKYLKALSDISMGESGKFNSLTLAFSQMSATGKLMGQDLNQMINAGFNPLQTISEKTGKSIATLKKEMSEGVISAEMVQQAFLDATAAGGKFYNMSENASKTINGQISMMHDALDNVFNELGTKGEGVIMSGIQMTTSLIENYETVGKVLTGLMISYGAYRTAVMLVTAAESKHTLIEIGLTNVRVLARKAQLALNAAMLTNPYVLAAVAVGTLVTAMWAFHDSTTAAEKAQKKFNDEQDKFNKQQEDRRQKIEKLIRVIQDETETALARKMAYEELKNYSPALVAAYKQEELAVASLTDTSKKLNEERDNMNYSWIIENINRISSRLKELRAEHGKLNQTIVNGEVVLHTIDNSSAIALFENSLRIYQDDLKKINYLRKEAEEKAKPIDIRLEVAKTDLSQIQREFDNVKKRLEEEQAKLLESPWMIIPFSLQAQFDTVQDALKKQQKKVSDLEEEKKKTTTYAQDLKTAKEKWEKAKKELEKIEKDKSNFSTKQYEDAKKAKETAEKQYKDLGGVIDTHSKDNSIADQAKKIADLEKKQAKERVRQAENLADQVTQSTIDAETDGFKKIQMQRDLDNKKEIQAIERQKEDYINSIIKAEEQKFDTEEDLKAKKDKNYKKKIFDPSSVIVDTSNFDKIEENTRKKQVQLALDIQEKAWNEYLREFGSYQEKRKAIVKLANDEIAKSETDGEKESIRKRTQDQLDELDNSVKNSATLMGQLFADASQKSVTEIQKIIEKAELLMQYLGAVKDEQGDARIGGKTVSKKDILGLGISDNTLKNLEMSADEVEALRNAIEKLKGDLGERSPFKLFKSQVASAVTKIKKGGKDNIAQGITEIGDSITSFTPSISEFGQNLGNIFGNDELGNKIAGVSEAIEGLGETAMGVGQIMAGDIVGGVMSAVSGISSTITSFKKIFGGKSKSERDSERLSKVTNKIAETNEIINKLIEKRIDLIKKATAAERAGLTQTTQDTIDIQKKRIEQEFQKLQGNEILGKKGKNNDLDVKDLGLNSVEDLEKFLSGESMWTPKKGYTSLLELESQGYGLTDKDKWYNLVEEWGKLNDQAEQLKETASEINTGITFDEARDSLDDLLLSADTTFEDIAGNFEGYMRQSILKMVKSEYLNKEMEKWYRQFDERTGDGELSKDDVDELQKQYENAYSTAQDKVNQMLAAAGLSLESSAQEQSATSRGVETITQDQAGEMNGRITDVQGTTRDIKDQNTQQTQSLNLLTMRADDILRVNSEVRNIADETRSLIANSYLELVQISENTGAIVKPIKEMNDKLDKIQKNTENL